jgi:hypothetical protein
VSGRVAMVGRRRSRRVRIGDEAGAWGWEFAELVTIT